MKENVLELVEAFGRPALHAATLGFIHPESGEFLKFSAPLPTDMTDALEQLRSGLGCEAS